MSVKKAEVLKKEKPSNGKSAFPLAPILGGQGEAMVGSAASKALATRQGQEVQMAILMAKTNPRNEEQAFRKVMTACQRVKMASSAIYTYPRGSQTVEGATIRTAEMMAQNWGNIDTGVVELSQKDGQSEVMTYAMDLETLAKKSMIFTVPHIRRVGKKNVALDDPRDIYEAVMNAAHRRLRTCILAVIPKDLQESALEECNRTMASMEDEDRPERIRKMLKAFAELGVTKDDLEAHLRHHVESTSEAEIISLRKIIVSIMDGHTRPEEWFATVKERPTTIKQKPDKKPTPDPEPEPEPRVYHGEEPEQRSETLVDFLARHGVTEEDAMAQFRGEVGWLKNDEGLEMLTAQQDEYIRENIDFLVEAIELEKGGGA